MAKKSLKSGFRELEKKYQAEILFTLICTISLVTGYFSGLLDLFDSGTERVFYIICYLSGGYFGFIQSVRYVLKGKLNVDVLMILAAIGAAIIDQWLEGAILLFLFSLSESLQHYAMGRSRREINSLMKLRPDKALLRKDNGNEKLVAVDSLKPGDMIIVKPGERIPIDGDVASGSSSVDQSTITGESTPVNKSLGNEVFAATYNQNGVLEIEVTKSAGETTLARIIKQVEEAQSEKAETQRFLDNFEPRYALGVILFTTGLVLIPYYLLSQPFEPVFYRAMTILVVASPCALIISTPASILSAIASSAKNGVLFKGGVYLEQANDIDTIAFDKTGTLTTGRSEVVNVVLFEKFESSGSEEKLIQMAASAEEHSEHHLAAAILRKAGEMSIEIMRASDVQAEIGKGVIANVSDQKVKVGNRKLFSDEISNLPERDQKCIENLKKEGNTVIFVQVKGEFWGVIAIADKIRPQAEEAIKQLRALGIQNFVILTGDSENVARSVAKQLQLDQVFAELLPDQKVDQIKRLTEKHTVAMVGDGVNDAPALAVSHLGIAMGAVGTDVALETADVVLMSDDLTKIPYLIDLARRSKKVVWQNIIFSLAVIALLIASVFLFELPLPLGVIAHEGSTLIVVLNGLRLLA